MNKANLKRGACVYILSMAVCCAAFAQSGDGAGALAAGITSAEPDGLQEIVVTTRRKAEGIAQVPLSVSAFDGDQLRNLAIENAADLPLAVPGLTYAKSGSNTPIYTLRGIGFNTRNLSSTSPVGVYYDEVAYAYPYFAGGPLFDLAETEVSKGPQGTLYGRNTTGGLINFITARPSSTVEGGVETSYGSYQTLETGGYLSGPVGKDLAARIAFKTENEFEGWQRSVSTGERRGRKDRDGFRFSLDWTPATDLSSQFTFNGWRDRSDSQAAQAVALQSDAPAFLPAGISAALLSHPGATAADWTPGTAANGQPPLRVDAKFYGLSERLSYTVSDALTLTSLTGFNYLSRDDSADQDGTPYQFATTQSLGVVHSWSDELRASGSFDRGDYTVGAYYSYDSLKDDEYIYAPQATVVQELKAYALAPFANPNPFNPGVSYTPAQIAATGNAFFDAAKQDSESRSLFADVTYSLADHVELAAGARYSSDRLSYQGCTYDVNGNYTPLYNTIVAALAQTPALATENGCTIYRTNPAGRITGFDTPYLAQNLNEGNLSYRTSLTYKPTGAATLYTSMAQGYKSGVFPVIPANVDTQEAAAKQEKVVAYEVGAKLKLFESRMQLNSAAFYYDYTDKQEAGRILDPVFTTLERIVNVPKSRVYGGEADLTWRVVHDLTLSGSATWLRSDVIDYKGYDDLGQPENFAGSRFAFTPNFQSSLAATYSKPLNDDYLLETTLSGSYQSMSYGDLANSEPYKIAPYLLLNGQVSLKNGDGWQISAFGRNLTDKSYAIYTGYLRETIFRYAGMPRTIGVRIGCQF